MQASYTKLRDGSWGVRVMGKIEAGASVTVTKRDGTTKCERVARVLWSDDAATVASIEQQKRPYELQPGNRLRQVYRRKYGWDGVVGSPSYYSSGLFDEES